MKNAAPSRNRFSSAKQSLLERRLRGAAHDGNEPGIARTSREGPLPLSFAQQRLWFLDQLSPGNRAYNLFEALRITGPLDASALEKSLAAILQRHEALRTTFGTLEDQPVQIIAPAPEFTLPVVDLEDLPESRRSEEAHRLAVAEAQRPFDLTRDLMLRPVLLRLSPQDHVLLIALHHIAADGWSLGVLYRDLTAFYQTFTQGAPPPPELPIQYADFAVWQRRRTRSEVLESELAWWKKQLAGAPDVLELPTDRPRPAVQTFHGSQHWSTLPAALAQNLKTLSRQQGVTLFMTLQAAFTTLLRRYTRQTDIVLGAPMADRTPVETEDLIGLFVNTLVLRTDLFGNPTFAELLQRVRAGTLGAYAHQALPFELLVKELKPERSISHMLLFQAAFVLQSAPSHLFDPPGLSSTRADVDNNTAKFDLTLSITDEDRGLTALWEYNRDLFDAATIERMSGHFQTLLEAIVAHPQKRLSELPLLTAAERHQFLEEWSGARSPYPKEKTIHQIFEEQTEATPDAVALIFEDKQITYQELNGRANQLARHLQKLGAGSGVLVCLCLERSVELIVALLGILKAGGAYVALDPTYPRELLAFMLQDTRTPILLTQEKLLNGLPDLKAVEPETDNAPRRICIEAIQDALDKESTDNLQGIHSPSTHLAYVSFTSGSTGRPKGVCVPHQAVVRLVKETNYARLNSAEVFLQFAPIPFDASTFEIWGCLLNGARLVIFPPEAPSLAELGEAIRKHRVTTLWLTAGLFHQMVEEQVESLRGLRQLLSGGDVLSPAHVKKAAETLVDCQIINGYGPTENTTFTCCYAIKSPVAAERSIPIGRPIANTQVYVLDETLQPVPVGVPGELYAAGDGLALGYLHRPELTAERFIANPFRPEFGARLYKTGDLARWLPDGQIEFLGRMDCQVKVRGFRIEPGEIETVLAQHGDVGECVVVAREDAPGQKQLVAYVVAAQGATPSVSELRGFLQQKLPHYMVPSLFVFLDSLPLTENGKVNRRALPAPGPARPELAQEYIAPQIPLEERLAEIWAAALRLDRVGVHDNFFELGGHSILAIQVASRIRDALKVDLPLRYFFECPTVAQMAQKLKQVTESVKESHPSVGGAHLQSSGNTPRNETDREEGDELSEIKRALLEKHLRGAIKGRARTPIPLRCGCNNTAPLSFAQQRLWFLDQLEPNGPLYNIPTAMRLTGKLDVQTIERAITAIVARHEVLRTRFVSVDGEPLQMVAEPSTVQLPVKDLGDCPEGERENALRALLREEARRPFDLSSDLMLRALLVRLGPAEHVLFLNLHHIAADEWSLGVFFHEFGLLYEAFAAGQTASLPELPIQYADYALWQREWLQKELLENQLSYWKRQLAGAPDMLDLPVDRPRPPVQRYQGSQQFLTLPKALAAALQTLSQREGVTLFMTLLAAFKTLLHRYTRQTDLLVGTPVTGRSQMETEGLIGFFINTLVLRTDLAGNPTFRDLLKQVHKVTLEAYAHQDLPFEKLVEGLRPERTASHTPLIQLMFVLQNTPVLDLSLPELSVAPVQVHAGTAKFDLTLSMTETPDGLSAELEYDQGLFDADTIRRMLAHFQTLLEAIVAHPEQRLSELALLNPPERQQLLVEWNDTRRDFPKVKSVHRLFEEQVERTPEAVAVAYETQQLTYAELNARANQLAHYLQRRGAGPDVCIGLYLERSPDFIVALLAILKSGSAYLPMDRAYPKERIDFMLQDAEVPLLVTEHRFVDDLPSTDAKMVYLDVDSKHIAAEPETNPTSAVAGENLAYVIYTSGSTGKPKGSCIPHRAINRLVIGTDFVQLGPSDVVAQVSNCSFDAATWEIWGALLNGARLVIITKDLLSPAEFVKQLKQQHITAMFLTTALFNQLASDAPGAFSDLRHLLFGGEAVEPKWVAQVLEQGPPGRLLHVYGPTETTTFATWHQVTCVHEGATTVPIGRQIANTEAYVLDEHLQPVPVGVHGELYIGGDGVGLGYLRRPELTVERFVPNPFSSEPGARLYKTGDLVRYLPDGNIEFVGRLDRQVKIRGFRVELGEIESVLGGHPGVRECAVTARSDKPGEKRLVAYVVLDKGQTLKLGELRDFLRARLPDYMVPSDMVPLEAMPLTPNGKVNRAALPAPGAAQPELEERQRTPRDATEQQLTRIWESVLGVHPIGVRDKFFELGGHSLLTVKLAAQIEKAFGKRLSLAMLFQHQTIEQMAALLREESSRASSSAVVEIQPEGSKPPIFFVHGVGGGMFWGYMNLSRCLGADQPVYALRSRGLDGREEWERIEEMAADYVAELRAFQPQGPYYLGGYCFGGNVAFEMSRQLRQQGQRVALLALINCAPPNSSYSQVKWTPLGTLKFLGNLFYWVANFLQFPPDQRRQFFGWKVRLLRKRIRRWFGGRATAQELDAESVVNLSLYPQDQRHLWETHIRALLNYHPQPYADRVTLFRSRGHPLLCSFDSRFGWGDLALGGVDLKFVSGGHERILEEPHVQVIARELKACLQETQAREDPGGHSSPGGGGSEDLIAACPAAQVPNALSCAQRRLWFYKQSNPNHHLQNRWQAWHLKGTLNLNALERSIREIVRRHEPLRTRFMMANVQAAQVVSSATTCRIGKVDLQQLPEENREEEASRLGLAEVGRPFDLNDDSMVRVTLFQLRPAEHRLLVVLHPLVADHSSLDVFCAELSALYEAYCQGKGSPLADLTARYSAFVSGQEQAMHGNSSTASMKDAAPAHPAWELPADHPAAAVGAFRSGMQSMKVPRTVSKALNLISHKNGVTLFMTLLAVFGTLIYRTTRQEGFFIRANSPGRNRSEFRGLIGCFDTPLTLRFDLSGNPAFEDLVCRIHRMVRATMEQPLDEFITNWERPAGDTTRHPRVAFEVQTMERAVLELAGLAVMPWALPLPEARFDLNLTFVATNDEQLTARLEYDLDRFEPATITRWLGRLETLLEAVIAEPEQPVAQLPLLSSAERQQVLVDWNATEADYPLEQTYAQAFEAQVGKTPTAPAIRFANAELTYAELNGRANQLARYLQRLAVGPEVLVAVHIERSIDFAVGVLGVLKAGGAYLPLDNASPPERLAEILTDSEASILLTTENQRSQFAATNCKVVRIDDPVWQRQFGDTESQANPASAATADSLAYVMYTSGSTGKPKGVQIIHRSLLNHNFAVAKAFHLQASDRILQFSSLSFDISVEELFPSWLRGALVVMRSPDTMDSPARFLEFVGREKLTILNLPTAFWHQLVPALGKTPLPPTVRLVVIGGEKASPHVYATWRRLVPDSVTLINTYGPTEATVTAALQVAGKGGDDNDDLSIGRPIDNVQIYLLDEHLQPVPIGTPGELHIGGTGVGRGYLKRPELTTEKFIPNPFRVGPNERLYRTGDLARHRSDGRIEFLGRADDQVKIRGFRVELSEIKSALDQHPHVKESVVLAVADSSGETRLAAYWVAQEQAPGDETFIEFLKRKLPEYMVPASFTRLETLPLSSHGKIDRKALPPPDWSRPALAPKFVAPRTPTEEQLAKIWCEVLGLSRVGVFDDFFELGGHSLHAMQVATRVRDTFQEETPLSRLFEMPTIAALGSFLSRLRRRKKSTAAETIPRASRDEPLPLSPDQQRLWFLHQLEPESPVYNVPLPIRLIGKVNIPALEQSLNAIVRRHEALRTTFATVDGQPVQNISPSASVVLAKIDLRLTPAAKRPETLRQQMVEEARRPFDLTRDLMLRGTLLQIDEAEQILLLTLHHIAADAWSMGVLLQELSDLYEAFRQGEPSPLPELPIQYADFALWQHRCLQGEHLDRELAYWQRQLADAPALLELPSDRRRPAVPTFAGARQPVTLSRPLTDALHRLSRQENGTLFMTLLAAFQTLIARYTGRQDILVGSPMANRTRTEAEKLIGFLVNTLVLSGNLADNPTFRKFLRQIRGTTLDAYAHQELPFEKVVERLQPKRDQSYHPLFQVMFVLQNAAIPASETAGLSWRPFDLDIGTAKFDLTLELSETAEGLTGWLEYSTDLFDAATMARMAGHFQTLLEGIAANPDEHVSALPLMSEAERHQLLVEWNDTAKPFPRDHCIHQLFEQQAARTPGATAVIFQKQSLTYGELNQRADQCAERLRRLGVGPEVVVGLCVERSLEMVVAIFGILKAGGAYLPMDPAYPRDRLFFMLEDARSPLLLTQKKFVPNFHASRVQLVCLDAAESIPSRTAKAALPSNPQSSHLAYVIYTSGSTGRPKGVALEHRNVVSFAHWAREVFSAQELAGVLFSTSICFDLSVFELFVPLSWGGAVILAENALQLPSLPAAERVTLVNTVPSAITELLRMNGIPQSACTVNLAGEPLSQLLVNELYQKRSIRKVYDLYGPTEDTVYSTFALRTPDGPATIGCPLSNEQVYLLDAFMQPVPVGVPGQLHIGGAGLARGYLHQPELTRQKFVPNPFQPGARLYQTGDRARYLADGRIEFLGRMDHQVKVRGYRIELGEIETQLRKHSSLRQAVVVAGEDRSGGSRLVAYVVAGQQPGPEPNELRAFLQKKLPDYMVPSLFVALEELPLTPNGKIDRKALPDPDRSQAEVAKAYTAPRTTTEAILTQIWCEVLNLQKIGIHDDFFELGGHSLMVAKVLARLRETVQVDLPMRVLFEAPTVATLARAVEEALIDEIQSLPEDEAERLDASVQQSNG